MYMYMYIYMCYVYVYVYIYIYIYIYHIYIYIYAFIVLDHREVQALGAVEDEAEARAGLREVLRYTYIYIHT